MTTIANDDLENAASEDATATAGTPKADQPKVDKPNGAGLYTPVNKDKEDQLKFSTPFNEEDAHSSAAKSASGFACTFEEPKSPTLDEQEQDAFASSATKSTTSEDARIQTAKVDQPKPVSENCSASNREDEMTLTPDILDAPASVTENANAPTHAFEAARIQTPREDRQTADAFYSPMDVEDGSANNIQNSDATNRTSGSTKSPTLIDMMPKQKKMNEISALTVKHKLDLCHEVSYEDFEGFLLLCGAQSAGKTATALRLIGLEVLISSARLGTRAPFLIICLNTPNPGENITLVLPEVCKNGSVVHEQTREDDISPKECCKSITKFHRVIASGEGIVANEVKIIIKSDKVPTMVIRDIPGLVPASTTSAIDQTSRDILRSCMDPSKNKIVNPLLCHSATCDAPGGFGATIKEIANENPSLLGNALVMVTKIDKSDDREWEDVLDEETGQKKNGPFYRLSEMINGQRGDEYSCHVLKQMGRSHSIVGLFNKNSASISQQEITIREQSKVEKKWIEERLEKNEITLEDASKLGIEVLAPKIDNFIASHLQGSFKKKYWAAIALRQATKEKIMDLGKSPSKISIDELKVAFQAKISGNQCKAREEMAEKIKGIWEEKMNFERNLADGAEPDPFKCCELAKLTFLGEEFLRETEVIMACKIREPLQEDSEEEIRGMQISRFDSLHCHYVDQLETLVAEYFESFKEGIKDDFKCFKSLIRLTDNTAKVKNLLRCITDCHKECIVDPLFENLHNKVCETAIVWQGTPVEKHSKVRGKLNEKLKVLNEIIMGWKELLPDSTEDTGGVEITCTSAASPGKEFDGDASSTSGGRDYVGTSPEFPSKDVGMQPMTATTPMASKKRSIQSLLGDETPNMKNSCKASKKSAFVINL